MNATKPARPKTFCVVHSRQAGPENRPRHIAYYNNVPGGRLGFIRTDDKTLCNVLAANFPESSDISTATCQGCIREHRKLTDG